MIPVIAFYSKSMKIQFVWTGFTGTVREKMCGKNLVAGTLCEKKNRHGIFF